MGVSLLNQLEAKRGMLKRKRARSVSMKRRAKNKSIVRKVRTLKKLVPQSSSSGGGSNCMGVEGLFRETAEYILSLQMRVKLMQTMVKVLSGSEF